MPLSDAFTPFQSLRNPVFARLYAAQTASLLGDALTWWGWRCWPLNSAAAIRPGFLISGVLIFTLPARLRNDDPAGGDERVTVAAVLEGTKLLWQNTVMRYALLLELVTAVSGALILVNTVGLVRGQLHLPEAKYGWVMAAFGVGATVAALLVGVLTRRIAHTTFVVIGAVLTTVTVLPANHVGLWLLMALRLLAGAGQNWVNLSTQTLIAEQTDQSHQGRVYGTHFAWSHVWWAFANPLAG